MFYEALTEKRAQAAEKLKDSMPSGAVGAGVSLLGTALAAKGGTYGASKLLDAVREKSRAEDRSKAYANIDPAVARVFDEDDLLTMEDGPLKEGLRERIAEARGRHALFRFSPEAQADIGTRGMLYAPGYADATKPGSHSSMLHELGHATGTLGRSRLWGNIKTKGRKFSRKSPIAHAGVGGYLASSANDEEDLERARKFNNLAAIATGLGKAPTLIEEGRANIRALGFGKKFDVPVSKMQLGAAMGTYLANAAGHTLAPYLLNKKLIERRREQLRQKPASSGR
mgnify:CR=1 FL=1